jgi:putative transcriptional regulator
MQLMVTWCGGEQMRNFLIYARNEKKLTHEQVAEHAEISRQYYGMIESGERNPSVPIAKKIGAILNIEWTLFFEQDSNLGLRVDNDAVSTS